MPGIIFNPSRKLNPFPDSGAEIVAGALKDAGRARLVGEKTFGTGTVLQTFSLSDGSALGTRAMIAIPSRKKISASRFNISGMTYLRPLDWL